MKNYSLVFWVFVIFIQRDNHIRKLLLMYHIVWCKKYYVSQECSHKKKEKKRKGKKGRIEFENVFVFENKHLFQNLLSKQR